MEDATWLRLERLPAETLRAGLERALIGAIREGALRAGARLPSSRRLAAQMGVSRGVASDVYAQLEAQGYIAMRARSAPVVVAAAHMPPALREEPQSPRAPRFDLTHTTPDVSLFPTRRWLAAIARAARETPAAALEYGDVRGDRGLRAALADHLGRTRGVVADPAQIVIVQGAAQAMDLLFRVLSERGRRRIAVEDPSLRLQRAQVAALGLRVVGCPVDGAGIRIAGTQADAAIVTPAHQFPTGVVLSGERRRELLAWVRARPRLIIEDDYDAEFRYDREPVRALQGLDPERVAYIGTVSKSLAPALRLGWLVVPPELAEAAGGMKLMLDHGSPALSQMALGHLLASTDYDRHVRRARAVYRRRRDRLVAALATQLPRLPIEGVAAGLHVLVRMPAGLDDERVAAEASRHGIRVEPLSRYAVGDDVHHGLIIGYGRVHESAIEPAVAGLAAAIAGCSSGAQTASARGATGRRPSGSVT